MKHLNYLLFVLAFSLAGCGGGGESGGGGGTPAPNTCVLAVSGLNQIQNLSTTGYTSCQLTVSGLGNTATLTPGSVLTLVTISGSNHAITFGAGSSVLGIFTLSASDTTITSMTADNIVIDFNSGIGNTHTKN